MNARALRVARARVIRMVRTDVMSDLLTMFNSRRQMRVEGVRQFLRDDDSLLRAIQQHVDDGLPIGDRKFQWYCEVVCCVDLRRRQRRRGWG